MPVFEFTYREPTSDTAGDYISEGLYLIDAREISHNRWLKAGDEMQLQETFKRLKLLFARDGLRINEVRKKDLVDKGTLSPEDFANFVAEAKD
jgi:hypothetical protein